ncbi:MAG: NADP-dependent isocitrate dehydrogenase [Deltaproteobacteria bacterium]|nr:NADP-dependent isocitrate dehydrogenase [Deltaproteobacteria bacterium]
MEFQGSRTKGVEMSNAGENIGYVDGQLIVPDKPLVAFMQGDGIGPDVWEGARPVLDEAVNAAYGGARVIDWKELPLGQSAKESHGALLPDSTIQAIRDLRVAIKGPTMTPVGGGHRSLNVTLRQELDLFANVRPVRHFKGVESPMRHPEELDAVIFRENTEDVYAGIEFERGSAEAARVRELLASMGKTVSKDAAIGIKPISRDGTRRLVRTAIEYALQNKRRYVTMMHKGNIMKCTEGGFREWGYELAREDYAGRVVAAADLKDNDAPDGVVIIEDRIADALFQDLLLMPSHFDVIAAPNLNGDYVSDACAAQVGGLGIAPGANIGAGVALFESTHGTAPDIAGKGIANPGSMMLSGAMLLEYLGWTEAASLVVTGVAAVLESNRMTVDLAAGRDGIEVLGTQAFSDAVRETIR